MATSQDFVNWVCGPDLDYRYLKYVLLAERDSFLRFASGTTHQTIYFPEVKAFHIALPPLSIQKGIANVLSAFDDRITLLRETNATLEAIAQALFKSWFVDFDPVHAKAEGRARQDGERSGQPRMPQASDLPRPEAEAGAEAQAQPEGMDAATAALFPDSFEESELGLVPKGWRVAPVGSVCCYLSRGISPKYLESGGILVLNQKCIRDFSVDYDKGRRHDLLQRKIDGRELAVGDVLVNSTGVGTLGRIAQVLQLPEPAIVDSHVTIVRAGEALSWPYLGQLMARKQPEIEAMGEGSTGQTELSRTKLAGVSVLIPPATTLNAFDEAVIPLKQRMAINERKAKTLTQLRDTLLPRLIAGTLRLPDAMEAIADTLPRK